MRLVTVTASAMLGLLLIAPYRDVAVVLEVAGEVDGRHAAGAELALDAVVGGEGRRQVRGGHAGRWGAKERDARRAPSCLASVPTIDLLA